VFRTGFVIQNSKAARVVFLRWISRRECWCCCCLTGFDL